MNKNLVYLCVLVVFGLSSLLFPASLDEEIDGSWVGKIKDDKIRLSFNIFDYGDNSGQWNTTTYFKRTEFSNLQFNPDNPKDDVYILEKCLVKNQRLLMRR